MGFHHLILPRRFDRKLEGEPKIRGIKRKVQTWSSVLFRSLCSPFYSYSLSPTSALQMRKGRFPSRSRKNWNGRDRLQRSRGKMIVPREGTMFSMCAKQFGTLVVERVPLLWLNATGRAAVKRDGQRQRARANDEWKNTLLFSDITPSCRIEASFITPRINRRVNHLDARIHHRSHPVNLDRKGKDKGHTAAYNPQKS